MKRALRYLIAGENAEVPIVFSERAERGLLIVIAAALLLGLPLLGVWLSGLPVAQYAEFPPLTVYRTPAAWSWTAAVVIFVIQIPLWLPVLALLRAMASGNRKSQIENRKFPAWGWTALAWTTVWWIIAWTRFPCFASVQQHTFTPLWLGYIAVVNALTFARSGRCLLTHEPRRMVELFAASAFFWWFFEYLNRFVQNWHYTGIENFSPWEYALFATPAFATVMPAIMSTAELLESLTPEGRLTRGFKFGTSDTDVTKLGGGFLLVIACMGLAGIGVRPDFLYPLLWLAPLFILTSLKSLRGEPTIFSPLRTGDWRRLAVLSLAALICGFFWEMWNWMSFAKWIYLVPFVGEGKVFEMPVLGFAGYLPFGWECAVIADALTRRNVK
jgi:hypothetical protein